MRFWLVIFIVACIFIKHAIPRTDSIAVLKDVPLNKYFNPEVYKGGIQNWAFDQDSSGILYVANNVGLLEFDGSRWSMYDVPECTKVRSVKVDKQNRIFAGGQGQMGYFEMSTHGLTFVSLLDKLPSDYQNIAEVWKIFEFRDKIYFVTESRLIELDGDQLVVLELPENIRLAYKVSDKLLVQFPDEGLFEVVGNETVPFAARKDLPDLIAIIPDSEDNFYVSRSGRIYTLEGGKLSRVELSFEIGEVNHVIQLNSGDMAFGTQNNGLFILKPDFSIRHHLTKNEGISDRTVKSLYEDGFNNLWVGLNSGIDYLELSLPITLIDDNVGLEGTGYAVHKFNNSIYLGTSNGLFIQETIDTKSQIKRYKLIPNSQGQVYNLSEVSGQLILNHNRGAFLIKDKERLEQFHDIGSWTFIETPFPDMILGGDYQGISYFKREGSSWIKSSKIEGLNESSRILEYENDSVLWMSHGSKGAYRLTFDSEFNIKNGIEQFGVQSGFPSNTLISVYSLNNKLVFTSEKGIFNYDNSANYFVPNKFFNSWLGTDHVSALVSNRGNSIYYIQNQSIGLLIQESFGSYRNIKGIFKHINRHINDDLANITILDEQNVLIGAKEGFIKYNPTKKLLLNNDFHVLIRAIEISSVDTTLRYLPSTFAKSEISIEQSITFAYTAPYFDGFEDLQYSYRLAGLDEKWSPWSPAASKEYPYLPPGNYTFELKGLNVYGLESAVISFPFKVLRPWYYSNAAILLYVLLALIIAASIPLIQRKNFRKEKSILHQNKEEELKLKNEKINQISIESKNEIDKVLNEKLRSEIDLKNDQLTTITLQLINNNEFIRDIRSNLEQNMNNRGTEKDYLKIMNTIDDKLSNGDYWDKFEYHFDQVHGDYLKKLAKSNIKLSPREIKLAAFLRMNMSSKEISTLMNITPRSVELARHRLRKKLKLTRDQNLVEYLIELDDT
jgi:DNA-binding CsgD family transcriptional regulator